MSPAPKSLRIRWIQQKMETEKWQLSYARWHERIVGRPVLAGAISFTSAVTGFPPLAVIAVLAGTLRMNFAIFLGTVLVGRTIRFWLVLAGRGHAVRALTHDSESAAGVRAPRGPVRYRP